MFTFFVSEVSKNDVNGCVCPKGLGRWRRATKHRCTRGLVGYVYTLYTGAWRCAGVRLETEACTNTLLGTAVQ